MCERAHQGGDRAPCAVLPTMRAPTNLSLAISGTPMKQTAPKLLRKSTRSAISLSASYHDVSGLPTQVQDLAKWTERHKAREAEAQGGEYPFASLGDKDINRTRGLSI